MGKHHVFLHIGPGSVMVDDALVDRLAEVGVQTPDVGQGHLDRADLDIRRAHKGADLRRKDVEGAWAKVCRRTFRLRGDAFLSVPGFAGATAEQAALVLDILHGLKVHLVVTADETGLPPGWMGTVRADRTHHVAADLSPSGFADALAAVVLDDKRARLDRKVSRHARRRHELQDQLIA